MDVIKRDERIEKFDFSKICKAVINCFKSVDEEISPFFLTDLKKCIDASFKDTNSPIYIEEIQDIIEKQLMLNKFTKAAKSFILYREEHARLRKLAEEDIKFIKQFSKSNNTADATIDDNSNVSGRNIGVLNAEIHKETNRNTNLYLWNTKVKEMFPELPSKQLYKDLDTILYAHDASSQILMPYCMSVSLYPFITSGLKELDGKSAVPKKIDSFCGMYINLIFNLAAQVKGAVATPEFLFYLDYYARKEWGECYHLKDDLVINNAYEKGVKTVGSQLDQYFQQVTYSINQPAAARGMQSAFVNFSFFDKYFFEGMFNDFVFPDGTKPNWNTFNWLQKRYLHWLNQERLKCMLTFPVCSYALLKDEHGEFKDIETFDFVCKEYAEGNSFFTYISDTIDSLSACCRLRSSIKENQFNFTNGQIGVMTGSKNVITLDLNRIIQDWAGSRTDEVTLRALYDNLADDYLFAVKQGLVGYIINILDRVYKYQEAYNELLIWAFNNKLFDAYTAGFINLDKQYLTIGISGLNQAAEFLGIECNDNNHYKDFCQLIFSTIKEQNTLHKTKHLMFNTEQVPAESAAIKLYNRDKKDGYWVPEDTNLYASYIFKPNDPILSPLDKIRLHGNDYIGKYLDGGAACHINLEEHLTKEQYNLLLIYAAKVGCSYLTFNVPNSECQKCGFITKTPITICPRCGSNKIDLYDRVIGFIAKISNWSKGRQIEQKTRVYTKLE